MNLGEWLEKRKTEGNLYSKSEFLPLRKCSYCGEVMYNRVHRESNVVYAIIRNKTVCVACKEERERAKQRDPYFEFIVDDESISKLHNEDVDKEQRVKEALELLRKEFTEVKITL